MLSSIIIAGLFVTLCCAQVTYNDTTGSFACSIPSGAFCAGESLQSNIIIRCIDGVGYPGNCNDNLAGEPPVGVNYSPCYQSSPTVGDAVCTKNGIAYGDNGTFPVPGSTISTGTGFAASATPLLISSAPTNGTVTFPAPTAVYTGAAARILCLQELMFLVIVMAALLVLDASL